MCGAWALPRSDGQGTFTSDALRYNRQWKDGEENERGVVTLLDGTP